VREDERGAAGDVSGSGLGGALFFVADAVLQGEMTAVPGLGIGPGGAVTWWASPDFTHKHVVTGADVGRLPVAARGDGEVVLDAANPEPV
jgi:hypothetical protein